MSGTTGAADPFPEGMEDAAEPLVAFSELSVYYGRVAGLEGATGALPGGAVGLR